MMKKSTKTLIALAGIGAVGAHVSLETIARLSFMSYNHNMSVPKQRICCTC